MSRRHWQTSLRVTNNSAVRSQTARPSRLANGFFSRPLKRLERPAAGRSTAMRDMGLPLAKTEVRNNPGQGSIPTLASYDTEEGVDSATPSLQAPLPRSGGE